MLARGELHCIRATTINEYRKHIEKDAALERRFQPVPVSEPSIEDAVSILRGLKEKYELTTESASKIPRSLPPPHCPHAIFPTGFCRTKLI